MKITTNELENMIAEEVAFVQERFMSGKFRKAIEKYQELQVQQQKLQKAFVGTKDATKREKLKAALVAISKKVKAAEADFNRALHVEPVDMYESEVNEAVSYDKKGFPNLAVNYLKAVNLLRRVTNKKFQDFLKSVKYPLSKDQAKAELLRFTNDHNLTSRIGKKKHQDFWNHLGKATFQKEETIAEANYKVAGKPVTLNKGKKSSGTDWTVTFKNGKTEPLSNVLSLIKPFPKGITMKEGKLNEDDDKYNSYSYQGDNLVAAITPAENFDGKYKGQMALVITDVMSSVARVFLVAPEKEFISKAGRFTKGDVKQKVEKAKKNGLAHIYMPKKIYDKLDDIGFKNKKKYGANMIQTHSLKPVKG